MVGIYLDAVRWIIEDAFPESVADVWAEEFIFPDKHCDIKARVDKDIVYVTIYPDTIYSEKHIAQSLISLIQELRGKEKEVKKNE